ncbi:inositol monophosphatase [Candidatus Woesearchaeota archaeon]|nr:inositol monophosphatase [Candidatus Woesearchaeota archaeon]
MNFKQTAIKAAEEAGRIQLSYFGKDIGKEKKKDDSFVTKADIESTKAIRRVILNEFPEHNIICEELGGSNKKSDYRWIIDPLDGTHNFIMGDPLFGTSIALEYRNEVIVGVVYLPFLKRLYYAEKGKGAFCNGKQIRVSSEENPKRCLFLFDAKIRSKTERKIRILMKLAKMTWRFRVYGVSIYHNLLVAEGKAGFNVDHGSKLWDISAALLMVEEAGGKVTDFEGKRWTPETHDYLASNGKVHDKILEVLRK